VHDYGGTERSNAGFCDEETVAENYANITSGIVDEELSASGCYIKFCSVILHKGLCSESYHSQKNYQTILQ
jgi:hypothetical protein